MNVRIFWVRAMKCMCAQTRPRFILSSERVFWGNGVWTHVNSKGKIPSTGKFPQRRIEPALLWTASPNTTNKLFRPYVLVNEAVVGEMTLRGNRARYGQGQRQGQQRTEKVGELWQRATSCGGRTQAGVEQNRTVVCPLTCMWNGTTGCGWTRGLGMCCSYGSLHINLFRGNAGGGGNVGSSFV